MPIEHTVVQGETTIGLAEKYGHFAETIWNDPANAELKRRREHMNVLFPGDRIVIPDLRPKSVGKSTERRHRFRRKGVPAQLRLQLFAGEAPRANQAFRCTVAGVTIAGVTDDSGVLEIFVPANARQGELVIGDDGFMLVLDLGGMAPIDTATGVQKRLANLGFLDAAISGEWDATTADGLFAFQERMGLEPTGKWDAPTKAELLRMSDQASVLPEEKGGE